MTELTKYNFDHKEHTVEFFAVSFFTVVVGLSLGGIVDAATRKLQKDGEYSQRKYGKALGYFVLQSSINILLLIFLTKSTIYFLPWFQLSVSGALFAVLLFVGQRNLTDNALRLTNF